MLSPQERRMKKISQDRSKPEEEQSILQYFFPHSSCAFSNKKEKGQVFCTLYNYNVFVA